jgi:hypothetical protein
MPVFITDKHLKASTTRKTYSDNKQLGFALRSTPNGVFTFYYQHLNKKTGKRDWDVIGTYPTWTPERARSEATRLAGLVESDKDIRQLRQQKVARNRAEGVTFQQLHDEYIDYCKQPVERRWGKVPRKETWRNIGYAFKRFNAGMPALAHPPRNARLRANPRAGPLCRLPLLALGHDQGGRSRAPCPRHPLRAPKSRNAATPATTAM